MSMSTTEVTGEGVTRQLARYALDPASGTAPALTHEAARAFLNYTGCVLGGCREEAVTITLAVADEQSGARCATVMGLHTKLDAPQAALVNCLASSIHTFDDTHLASVMHPTGPVAAALMALMEQRPQMKVSGAEFLAALAVGVEISCRVANTLTAAPATPHLGLFTTGLAGGIGAAAGCGRLLGLDETHMTWALGIAAAQGCGFRATHSTQSGGLVPALGARNGLQSALLAEKGFNCSLEALEGRNGFFEVFAGAADARLATAGLGQQHELLELSYKPYPCGVVIHPAIDAALDLAADIAGREIRAVHLKVHPLALQLTGTRHPASGFHTKNSIYHWTAAALLYQQAGLAQATDAAVHDPATSALRGLIEAEAVDTLERDAVQLRVELADGAVLAIDVPHARGSLQRPLTDADLARKFLLQAESVLAAQQAASLLKTCQGLALLEHGWLADLTALVTPG